MKSALDPTSLTQEARAVIDRAATQQRDLSDFESGRVDVLLELAQRLASTDERNPNDAT